VPQDEQESRARLVRRSCLSRRRLSNFRAGKGVKIEQGLQESRADLPNPFNFRTAQLTLQEEQRTAVVGDFSSQNRRFQTPLFRQ
jgi:hypothetical protein